VDFIPWTLVNTSDSHRVFCWSLYKKGSSEIVPTTAGTLVIMVWFVDGSCCYFYRVSACLATLFVNNQWWVTFKMAHLNYQTIL